MSSSSNPPAFEIPSLIPPLPSCSALGKENDRKVRNYQKDHHDTSMSKESPSVFKPVNRSGLGLRTPQTGTSDQKSSSRGLASSTTSSSASRLHHRLQLSPSPGSTSSVSKSKGRSVLRFGESTEFLFCLTSASSHEHRHLARGIVDGSLADDPKAWRQVLKFASALKTSNGTDLIRLHRRATLRFPLDQIQKEQYDDVVNIWLAFASIHAKLGMMDEARRTCRYMENQKLSLGASYYVEVSRMERKYDRQRSEEILLRGLKENAEPRALLQEALDKIQGKSNPLPSVPSLSPSNARSKSSLSPKTRKSDSSSSSSSPKRQKTENGFVARDNNGKEASKPEDDKENIPALLPPPTKMNTQPKILISNSKPAVVTKSANLESKPKALRSSRLSASRLRPKGLSGTAKRVEPEASMIEESQSEAESTIGDNTGNVGLSQESSTQPKPSKFKKLDLNYMWEWDPSVRGKTQEMQPPSSKPTMEKIEEASASSGQTTNASSHATNRSSETTTTTNASSIHSRKTAVQPPPSERTETSQRRSSSENPVPRAGETANVASSERTTSPPQQDPLADVNMEFLPLVHESNILRVNGSSYAKLGVIGKGGSCKVYRALSKKCSVVAIKKVKLDGMDQKAIEGYANEISLLKRLRGNPAIIQMHDSEVDLARKSIFVVMELGEADLNQILQQRALAGTSQHLSMNFIRLTWQQMLSAVHCIHEERIIHSDLKPANFLFVRGALKLIDFGIAKAIQSDDTTNIYRENHIGTLNYMSPEAILDTETGSNGPRMRIGRASDVWSLGCILYEMIHGKTPFAKLHFIQKLQAIVNPNYPIEYADDADEGAIDAIKLCLQRNPEKRPPIMGEGGLLDEHRFLHSMSSRRPKKAAESSSSSR